MTAVKELDEWAESITEVEDETTKTLAEPADEMLDDAPGAMSLKHNQDTEKSNLKAFDLDEEGIIDKVKKVGSKVFDKLGGGSDEDLLKDLQKKAGIPKHAQHGKPNMAKPKDEEVDECKAYVQQCMTTAPAWCSDLPLDCEIGVGDNYKDAK